MRRALFISALLHVVVIAIGYFGLPTLLRPDPIPSAPVVVEVVTALPEDAKPPPPKQAPKPLPKETPRVKDTPPPQPSPPPPAIPEPPPMPFAEAPAEIEPPPPPPKAAPEPKPKPVAAPKPKPAPKVQTARLAPVPKIRPKQKPKPPTDGFQSLLKNLAPPKPAARKQAAAPGSKATPPAPDPVQSAVQRRAVEAALTRLVRQQIIPCWNIPAGAKDVRDMKIGMRIRLNRDGSIIGAPELIDSARDDPFYRAVAESARRALQNPQCQPLNLPRQQYEIWKSITFNFDPSEALGP
jgi:hypothetical protein